MSGEKKEGATMACGTCGNKLIYKMSDYPNHQNKLQWQNEDGGAHYKYVREGVFNCISKNGNYIPAREQGSQSAPKIQSDNVNQSKGRDTTKIDVQKMKNLDELDQITTGLIQKDSILLWKVREVVEQTIKELEHDPHGGMIGQFTEIIWNKHFGEKKIE